MTQSSRRLGMCRALSCFKVLSNWTKEKKTICNSIFLGYEIDTPPPHMERVRWCNQPVENGVLEKVEDLVHSAGSRGKISKKGETRKGEDKYINFALSKMSIKEPQTDGRRVCRHNRTLRLRLPPLFFFSQTKRPNPLKKSRENVGEITNQTVGDWKMLLLFSNFQAANRFWNFGQHCCRVVVKENHFLTN